jgi:quercetin dioxygenase-like cupin family protein
MTPMTTTLRAGDAIENPVTGEHVLFHATSAETDGELVDIEVTVRPGGGVATHVHPYQSEYFEILEGTMEFRQGGRRIVPGPGEIVTVEAGTPHSFGNVGVSEARFRAEVRPALAFERFLQTMFALVAAGKTNRRGMPNPLRLAVIARAHFDDVRMPHVPAVAQRASLAMGAAVGRLAGYGPTYESARELAPACAWSDD